MTRRNNGNPRRSVELTDPRALRALAHPIRLHLVGLLRHVGPLTATQAGERLGESPASCSFHFRQLARWGLVEEAGGGRGRERPWRATAEYTSWKVEGPETIEPSAALGAQILRQEFERMLRAIEHLPSEGMPWQRAHQLGDTVLRLTPSELEALGKKVWNVIRSYEKTADSRTASSSSRMVEVVFVALPRAEGKS